MKPLFLQGKRNRLILASTLVIIGIAGLLFAAYNFHLLGLGVPDCTSRPTSSSSSAYFVILLDNRGGNIGMNGSGTHAGNWPVLNISQGQSVTIHVWNVDPVESHGFAIVRYFSPILTLSPNQCFDVKFTADALGSFQIYCSIYCSIHQRMQNGVLNVNP